MGFYRLWSAVVKTRHPGQRIHLARQRGGGNRGKLLYWQWWRRLSPYYRWFKNFNKTELNVKNLQIFIEVVWNKNICQTEMFLFDLVTYCTFKYVLLIVWCLFVADLHNNDKLCFTWVFVSWWLSWTDHGWLAWQFCKSLSCSKRGLWSMFPSLGLEVISGSVSTCHLQARARSNNSLSVTKTAEESSSLKKSQGLHWFHEPLLTTAKH